MTRIVASSPRRWVMLVEPFISLNRIVRKATSLTGLSGSLAAEVSWMRPMKDTRAPGSTSMMVLATRPCASLCTASMASALGASTRQKALPTSKSNQ